MLDQSTIVCTLSTLVVGVVLFMWFKKSKTAKQVLLKDPEIKYKVPLIAKENINWNTRRFRFGLPTERHVLGVNPGQHIYLSAQGNNELIIRPYSPVSSDETLGYFDLVIKVYFKDQHPNYPDGGKMSQYLESMAIGDTIDIRGPEGKLIYASKGDFLIKKTRKSAAEKFHYKNVGMIAGGTGIAPLFRIINEIIDNPEDNTKVWLIFANNNPDDILLKEELEEITQKHGDQVKIWYTLVKADEGWKYSVGFVDENMIKEHMPPPSDDSIILMCGPPPMIKFACTPNLDKLGYSESKRFVL